MFKRTPHITQIDEQQIEECTMLQTAWLVSYTELLCVCCQWSICQQLLSLAQKSVQMLKIRDLK